MLVMSHCLDIGQAIQSIRTHVDAIHTAQPEINKHAASIEQYSTAAVDVEMPA